MIAVPSRKILVPSFTFPAWVRNLGDRVDGIFRSPMGDGAFVQPMGGATTNVLASVPWVAQWKFNNNGNDSIGSNNLTNNNSSTFTTGKLGGATGATQLVAASRQYWSIADNAALSTGDVDFTVAAWVYFDTLPVGGACIASKWTAAGSQIEWALDYDGTSRFRFYITLPDGTNAKIAVANNFGLPTTAMWICVVGWHDSALDTVNISINDGTTNSVTTSAVAPSDTTGAFYVGSRDENSEFFNGRLDNVCIAKSAAGGGGVLTAAQRTAFFNAGVGTENLS